MEEKNESNSEELINKQFDAQFGEKKPVEVKTGQLLPNGTAAFVLGIVGIVTSVLWCYGIFSLIGLICGIVAVVLAGGGKKLVSENPNLYSVQSINNNNTGKILGIIAIVFGALGLLGMIIFAVIFGLAMSGGMNGIY